LHIAKINNHLQANECAISDKRKFNRILPFYIAYLPLAYPSLFLLYYNKLIFMDITTVSLILSGVAIILTIYSLLRKKEQKTETTVTEKFDSMPLRLQAYERLVLLTERVSLPNLISRLNQPGISAHEMKIILTENIKQEFEYNSTQQLYVSQEGWDSIRNLKEQNIMVINQVSNSLPLTASSSDLNKKILEVLMSQPVSLHEMVLQVLNFEAKKLMK
jgi:hypothetical protein